MKISKTVALTLVTVVAGAILGSSAVRAEGPSGKKPIVWAQEDLKWTDNPAMKGARMAVLWGDPKTSGYGAFKSITAGGSLPLHTHSRDQIVICIAGTIMVSVDKEPAKAMGPGSYLFMPAGIPHSADCKAGADCMYFEEQQGASDIKFVEKAPPAK